METGVYIGNKIDAVGIEAAKLAVMELLTARADQETIRKALDAFVAGVAGREISNTNISDTTIGSANSFTLDELSAAITKAIIGSKPPKVSKRRRRVK